MAFVECYGRVVGLNMTLYNIERNVATSSSSSNNVRDTSSYQQDMTGDRCIISVKYLQVLNILLSCLPDVRAVRIMDRQPCKV